MVKLLKWIKRIFDITSDKPKRGFCYWCHRDNCPFPDFESCKNKRFQCEYHPEVKDGSSPSFCHRCSHGWRSKDTWVKPTIYKPNTNRADTRWCLDWVCEECDKKDKERRDLDARKYNNTIEAAKLVFTEKDGKFFYEGSETIEADFELSYETLAPYVKKAIAGANSFHYYGCEFDAIVIRDGCLYTRSESGEQKVTWEKEDV